MSTESVVVSRAPQRPGTVDDADDRAPLIYRYDEADVERCVPKENLGVNTRIAIELGAARSAEEKARLVRSMIRVIGFDTLRYFTVRADPSGRIERVYLLDNYLPGPAESFFRAGHYLGDPRFEALMSSLSPCIWDIHQLTRIWRSRGAPASYASWLARMRADGKLSGLAFAVPLPGTSLRSIISLSSTREHAKWISHSVTTQALTLGLSIHQRCSAYVRAMDRDRPASALSELQLGILELLVSGLSDKEIAARLSITIHNVDYHLRRLRDILGETSRTGLAWHAGRTGLVG
ncbi:helix-turn-helix transcriptional regulator [Paraburkholderia phosphatilytica]|uniref:helix-turn-helix transcriptional regulator n=1 Tax=Paraburkholderia phosphatilytica TaxID=2282883 RepID=UPI000E52CA4E|nr:LuxR family transcriptional regulator [Paraburkholderia phosphatilytica]